MAQSAHVCQGKRCATCYWQRKGKQILDEHPWIEVLHADPLRVGCSLCRQKHGRASRCHAQGGGWRDGNITSYTAVQPRSLKKHEGSDEHQLAVGRAPVTDTASPTSEEFNKLLQHCQRSVLGKDGVPEVAGQKKARKMVWCLAEAHRALKRQCWREGKGLDGQPLQFSTTLFQDARKGKLSVRFMTASSAAEHMSGHMWTVDLARDFSLDAVGVAKATQAAVRSFCTPFAAPPHYEKPHEAQLDVTLWSRVQRSIESFVSDSASDEIRAGHMLAGQRTTDQYVVHFPNLRVVARDKPHATRRNLSRGWQADCFLHEVAERFIFGADSPARMIQHSQVFRSWFAESIQQLEPQISAVKAHAQIKDLAFAPHRYESAAKPLTRIVLFFFPLLRVLVRIATERSDEKSKAASSFLEWLSVEKALQAAMLADASVENLELTRLVDYEGFPVAELPINLAAFRDRIRALFTGERPACLDTGLTRHMLRLLDRGFLVNIPGRGLRVKDLRRPSPVLVTACSCRMANWVRLTEATLSAEFPNFEVSQAFGVFSVQQPASEHGAHLVRSSSIGRLQNAFKLPADGRAGEQAQKLWHVARRIAQEENLSAADAWMAAVRHVTHSWSKQDVGCVLPVLVRFWAAGVSTSGVEQAFSRAKALSDHLQLIAHVNDIMEAPLLGTTPNHSYSGFLVLSPVAMPHVG